MKTENLVQFNDIMTKYQCSQEPKTYVQVLLDVHQKYRELVTESFAADPAFTTALDKACSTFINKNCVTGIYYAICMQFQLRHVYL